MVNMTGKGCNLDSRLWDFTTNISTGKEFCVNSISMCEKGVRFNYYPMAFMCDDISFRKCWVTDFPTLPPKRFLADSPYLFYCFFLTQASYLTRIPILFYGHRKIPFAFGKMSGCKGKKPLRTNSNNRGEKNPKSKILF